MTDIFRFWAKVRPTDYMHPADRDVLSRVRHQFDLKCLPVCFAGPLRTAPVVLLYLSPGLSEKDRKEAKSKPVQDHWMRVRRGRDPFPKDRPSSTESPGYAVWYDWVRSRTKCLGDWSSLHSKVAILDISAYHSKTFADYPLLAALPSSRVSIAWAQDALFPQAIAGKRVVICLRAAPSWGLKVGKNWGFLFAPPVTQGGHMQHGKMREQIIEAVKSVTDQP